MSRFDSPLYDDCRIWIQKKQEKGIDWPSIRLACKNDTAALAKFLLTRKEEDDWPMLSVDDWTELVEECEEYLGSQQDIKFRGNDGALFDRTQDNGLRVPENPRSCWQLYKNGLNWKEDSIQDLEDATIGILKRLSTDTRDTGAIKGLVIGHVQSGKTANMEALMAMAADHGWNMFIVLSGTIENLRLQTLKRMQNDLNREGNLIWRGFEHPSKSSQYGERARDFHFEDNAQSRYFTVCLKNASRLRKLIDWIHADKAAHDKMRILIIDDEADQASVSNTATEYAKAIKERKGINKLIVDIVGLFVANSDNRMKDIIDPKTGKEINLEEYIRQGEKADHASWTDRNISGTNPRVITKIQNGVITKVSKQFKEKDSDIAEKKNIGLGHALANILLPSSDFGRRAITPNPPPPNPTPPVHAKKSKLQITSQPTFADGNISVCFELVIKKNCTLSLQVVTDFKKFRADEWEDNEKVGKKFPLEFEQLQVLAIRNAGEKKDRLVDNTVLTNVVPSVTVNGIEISLLPSERFGSNSSLRIIVTQPCVLRGTITFSSKDANLKGVFELKEDK